MECCWYCLDELQGGGGNGTLMILLSEVSRVTCLFMVLCFYGVI